MVFIVQQTVLGGPCPLRIVFLSAEGREWQTHISTSLAGPKTVRLSCRSIDQPLRHTHTHTHTHTDMLKVV